MARPRQCVTTMRLTFDAVAPSIALFVVAAIAYALGARSTRATALARARASERAGRTRAEKRLREVSLELERARRCARRTSEDARTGSSDASYDARPIGTFASAFDRRTGTPRQGNVVPLARGRVELEREWVSGAALDGLEEFTHCWLIYVFHANTDLGRKGVGEVVDDGRGRGQRRTTARAKIRVPRLNGEKRGCLATRTPHRPCNSCPIGLSLVEVLRVRGTSLDVAGADLVDGTPILDIKPYVPYSDCIPSARAPNWVGNALEDGDGPLTVDEVSFTAVGEAAIRAAWHAREKSSMYESADEFIAFVTQVLSRDIRSYHQRLKSCSNSQREVDWRVSLDGIVVIYRQADKAIEVTGVGEST